jgi:hypothetical protein
MDIKDIKKLFPWANDPLLHNDGKHKNPKHMTRRELISQGFLNGVGMMMIPSLLGSLSKEVLAQQMNCSSKSLNPKIPFIGLDLAGGANIAGGNVMVGGPNGQMDALSPEGYTYLGFAPNTSTNTNNELGIIFHGDSAFLRGIKSKASAAALARVNGAIACCRLANDTQNNTQSPLYGIAKAGAEGAISRLAGTSNSVSGGRSMSPTNFINDEWRPALISNYRQLTGTIDLGTMAQEIGAASAASVFRRIANLSNTNLNKVQEAQVKKDLLKCGYKGATDTIVAFSDPAALDVMSDNDLVAGNNAIFNVGDISGNRKFNQAATYAKAIVNGYVGAGVMTFGGYDYHNGSRATGEVRDFEAGVAMGAAIEYAHRKNQPLVFYTFSDGSVRSDGQLDNSADGRGKGVWRGDSGTTSAALILVYNPNGRAQLTPLGHQLGHYMMNGRVDSAANLVANSATNLAYWVILNYMALNNNLGQFGTLFPEQPFGTDLDSYVHFQPIV